MGVLEFLVPFYPINTALVFFSSDLKMNPLNLYPTTGKTIWLHVNKINSFFLLLFPLHPITGQKAQHCTRKVDVFVAPWLQLCLLSIMVHLPLHKDRPTRERSPAVNATITEYRLRQSTEQYSLQICLGPTEQHISSIFIYESLCYSGLKLSLF